MEESGMTSDSATSITQTREFTEAFKQRKTQISGNYLHYVVGGQGEPVVLAHGFPQTWCMWRKIMLPLAEHHTVIAPDMRGLGDSDKPPRLSVWHPSSRPRAERVLR
jgi:pimeloyl-ACP methyl ester carboxylesterase